jgi:ribosomal protein L37AE/L43A
MNWPFDSKLKTHLVLECPLCKNRLQFKAIPMNEQLIWSCESCNHVINLELVQLQTRTQKCGETIYH